MKRVVQFVAGVVALALIGIGVSVAPASASTGPTNTDTVTHSTLVSDVPMAGTPNIDDGTVLAFAQVGNTTIVGGTFTGFTDVASGTHYAQKKILAFNSTTGAVIPTFAPKLDGNVNSLVPGPVANSVLVGGEFNVVSGVQSKSLVTARRDHRCGEQDVQAAGDQRQGQRHQARRHPALRRRQLHDRGRHRARRARHRRRHDRRARPVREQQRGRHTTTGRRAAPASWPTWASPTWRSRRTARTWS